MNLTSNQPSHLTLVEQDRKRYIDKFPLFVCYATDTLTATNYLSESSLVAEQTPSHYVPIALLNLDSTKTDYYKALLIAAGESTKSNQYYVNLKDNLCYVDLADKDRATIDNLATDTPYGMIRVIATRDTETVDTETDTPERHTSIPATQRFQGPAFSTYGAKLVKLRDTYFLIKSIINTRTPVRTYMLGNSFPKTTIEDFNNYLVRLSDLLYDNIQSVIASLMLSTYFASNPDAKTPQNFNYLESGFHDILAPVIDATGSGDNTILNELQSIYAIYCSAYIGTHRIDQSYSGLYVGSLITRLLSFTFKHYKSGQKYKILGFAFDGGTANRKPVLKVVYYSVANGNIWLRNANDWVRSFQIA